MSFAVPAMADQLLTGPQGSTRNRIGDELARFTSLFTDLPLDVEAVAGPTEVLQRLRDASQQNAPLTLGLLQADVAPLYLLAAEHGNPQAAAWLAPLRVVAPLYREELHFIVRSDSPLRSMRDLRNARIAVGPLAGSTALSVATLYRLLFDATPDPEKLIRLEPEQALAKLLTDHSIDVVALLADQPAPLLTRMKPAARSFVRLLPFDPAGMDDSPVLRTYRTATLSAASYPNLLSEDLPTLSVPIYLVTQNPASGNNDRSLIQFAIAYCSQLPLLKTDGHAKWRDVPAALPALAPGWHYSRPAALELARCFDSDDTAIPDNCPPRERALHLCEAGKP